MSAFVGILSERLAFVGTDTLVRGAYQPNDEALRVRLFASKTFQVPQFKSIFAVTGHQDVGIGFLRFLLNHCIGIDIRSIVNVGIDEFKQDLENEFGPSISGTIYLYGLDTENKRIKAYWLPINKPDEELVWRPLKSRDDGGSGLALMPPVDDLEDKVFALGGTEALSKENNESEIIKRLIRIQRIEDDQKDLPERLGIGGEIIITTIGLTQDDTFLIQSQIPYTFPDYILQGNQMIANSKNNFL